MSCSIVGCDPGLSGALAFVFDNGEVVLYDMPCSSERREIDPERLNRLLRTHNPGLAIIEDLHGPAVFKLGMAYGTLICSILSARFRLERVAPATWQSSLLGVRGSPSRKDTKQASVRAALKLYPAAQLVPDGCRAPKHDRADALCIAHYGLTKYVRL